MEILEHKRELSGGDFLFLVSCHEYIESDIRERFRHALVLHASDLPEGRGWSPHIWQVLEGRSELTVSLLEVEDRIDSGDIWAKEKVRLEGHELSDEIGDAIFTAELKLMEFAIANESEIMPVRQTEASGEPYRRRTPEDSRLDPEGSLAEQFELFRVADPDRYPAFVDFRGCRYRFVVSKVEPSKPGSGN